MPDVIESIRAVLSITPARWLSLTEALPRDLLSRPPAPKQWSALECLQHLIVTEGVFQSRLQVFLEGRDSFPAFDPNAEGFRPTSGVTPSDLAEAFSRLRGESLKALEKVTADDLKRQAQHQELGPVTLEELLHEWPAHDLNHTVQAERALMQPFIHGSGPWKPYFADHLVGEA